MVESEHPACSALRGRGCRHLCTVGAALSCCWNGPAHGEAAVVPFDPFMTTTLNPYGISACRCVTSLHKCAKPTQAGLPPPQSVPRVCDLSPVDLDARTVKPSAWLEMPEVGPARNAPAVLLRTLIKPMHASPPGACTRLCAHDSISVGTISARAYGFQGQIDVTALAAAVANLVTDLPILAGRMDGLSSKNASIRITHTDQGALFTVARAPGLSLSSMAPDTWITSDFTLGNSLVPFYMEGARMEGGRAVAMLQGKEPLFMVRLIQLRDGCILGITINHAITDGARWPQLMNHLAARYRQYATGTAPQISDLIQPNDRTELSASHVAEQLGLQDSWNPRNWLPQPTFADCWRACQGVLADATDKKSLAFLHIPKEQLSALKQLAVGVNDGLLISTGDAVQAAATIIQLAALGEPLLLTPPRSVGVMAQLKAPDGFFGNAAATFYVSVPPGTEQLDVSPITAFQQLAGAIRRGMLTLREPVGPSYPSIALPNRLLIWLNCVRWKP